MFYAAAYLAKSPITHSLNVSPTLKLETTEMSPLLRAESGCSLYEILKLHRMLKVKFFYNLTLPSLWQCLPR